MGDEEGQLGKHYFSKKHITRVNPSIGTILVNHTRRVNVRILKNQKIAAKKRGTTEHYTTKIDNVPEFLELLDQSKGGAKESELANFYKHSEVQNFKEN